MTDYPPTKKARPDTTTKSRSGDRSGKNRPLSGMRASPSLHDSTGSELGTNQSGIQTVKNFKGPKHPFPSIDKFLETTKPEEWNNIPLPIVDTIKQLMIVCLDIKKTTHDNWNEIMQTNHTANLIQAACSRDVKAAREEQYENLVTSETRFKKLLEEKVKLLQQQLQEAEDKIIELSRQNVASKMQEETVLMKQWATHLVQDQVTTNSRTLSTKIDKNFKEITNMFNVPGVIGQVSKDGTGPEFFSYEEFIVAMTRRQKSQDEYQNEIDSSIESMWKKCEELNKLIKIRVTESNLEQSEKQLIQKMDEKIKEVGDHMKRDRLDNVSKLAVVKSEFTQKTFDTDTFNFLRNQVRYEWPTQMTKINENDKTLSELLEKHEEVSQLLNKTIAKLKQGNTLDEEDSEPDDAIQEEDEIMKPLRDSKGSQDELNMTKSPTSSIKHSTLENDEKGKIQSKQSTIKEMGSGTLSDARSPRTSRRSTILQNVPRKYDKNTIQVRVEELEKQVENFGHIQEQIDELNKHISLKKLKKRVAKSSPKNKKAEKADEAKKKMMHKHGGKILEIIGNKQLNYCDDTPLSEDDMIFEGNPYTKPLEWNLTNKRWMGHDQITVETAFKLPEPTKSKRTAKSKDGVVDIDGLMRHQEHREFRTYVQQYDKEKIEREIRERMLLDQNDDPNQLAIAAKSVKQMPRSEFNVTQPTYVRHNSALRDIQLGGTSPEVFETGDTRMLYEEEGDEVTTDSPPKMKPMSANSYTTQPLKTNIYMKASRGSGYYTNSMANVEEKETDNETSNMLSTEVQQVKQYARNKSLQKNSRKLFRPQTGTVEGKKKAFGMLPHSRQTESGMDLGAQGLAAFEIPQSRLNGEISSNAFLPATGENQRQKVNSSQMQFRQRGGSSIPMQRPALMSNQTQLVLRQTAMGERRPIGSSGHQAIPRPESGTSGGNVQMHDYSSTSIPLQVKFDSISGSRKHFD